MLTLQMKHFVKLSAVVCFSLTIYESSTRIHCVSSFQLTHLHSYDLRVPRNSRYAMRNGALAVHSDEQTSLTSSSSRSQQRTYKSRRTSNLRRQSRETLQLFEQWNKQQSPAAKRNEVLEHEVDKLLESTDLTQLLVPRDASSLIRLLGRNRIYDAMLKLTRRYCRHIIDSASVEREPHGYAKEDAQESVLYCYTAAIGACSKPTYSSSPSTTNEETYRNKTFLLSLLDEMEHNYTASGEVIKPNSYTLSAVLLGVDNGPEAVEVLNLFERKYCADQSDHSIVTVQVYNAAISACCSRSPNGEIKEESSNAVEDWQLGLFLYNRMKRYDPAPNEQTHMAVLQALAEFGQVRVAMSIFDDVKNECSLGSLSNLYKPLLKSCATAAKSDAAEALLQQMKNDGVIVTTDHMNLFLLSLAKCNMHTKALEVLQEMINLQDSEPLMAPDIFTFNTVLSACANANEYEAARELLDDMKEGLYSVPYQGNLHRLMVEIRPDVISYNTVISCADPVSALELINEMRLTRRHRVGVVHPNSISYTNAIARCRKASTSSDPETRQYAFDIAFTLFEMARDSALDNTVPTVDLNVYLYSSMIWVAESVGNYKAAVQLLRSMECPPNAICYDGVISACGKRGLYREALFFYYEMQNIGLPATKNVYMKLAFAINNARAPEIFASPRKKAALLEGVLSQMSNRDRSVSIGGPLFEALIRCHANKAEAGSSSAASRKVYDQIVGPVDNACLSAMLRAYASESNWEDAVMLVHCSDIVKESR
jgi:pentatricopeptide repeat protein